MMQNKMFNGFMAALLHDIGKLILDHAGDWGPHEKMDCSRNTSLKERSINFEAILKSELYSLICEHGKFPEISANNVDNAKFQLGQKIRNTEISIEMIALILGDRLQKGMHGISVEVEKGSKLEKALNRAKNYPHFFPYYGKDKRWDQEGSAKIITSISKKLEDQNLNLKIALDIQESLREFPHTTYIPHISLSLHQRFAAVLYYFLYKKLKECSSITQLSELRFFVIQITPDPPNLLYRMKDVRTIKKAMERLRKFLTEEIFHEHSIDLPGMTKETNPFEFFSGDSIVCIHEDIAVLLEKLQTFINKDFEIQTLHLSLLNYRLELKKSWNIKRNGMLSFYSQPKDIIADELQTTLISVNLKQYPPVTMVSCSKCNKPILEPVMDSKDDPLCPKCFSGRERRETGISIEEVSMKGEGREKIGFLSITLPEDIREEAVRTAREVLIPGFKVAKSIDACIDIPTTNTGLFEYLQAVSDIACFQTDMDEGLSIIKGIYETAAYTIYQTPSCVLYLLREDCYWDFLWFILEEKKKLHMSATVKGVICDSRYPFWSLINKLITYTKENNYYDASERRVVMFTDGEVMSIRELANMAKKDRIYPNQLQILVQTAIRSSLEELLMEIEVRERDSKLGRSNFASRLISKLRELKGIGEDYRDREKRSIFIKYISKLAR